MSADTASFCGKNFSSNVTDNRLPNTFSIIPAAKKPKLPRRQKGISVNIKSKRFALKFVLIFVIAFALLLGFVSNFLVSYALGRSGSGANRTVALDIGEASTDAEKVIAENRALQDSLNEDFQTKVKEEPVSITSSDGLLLKAGYYAQAKSHDWVILIHGYRKDHQNMLDFAEHYYDAGYQVLAPDLRACGESEGNFVGMGWLDKDDILRWIGWIVNRDADASIVLHGVSMGAATVMMTSGEATPDNVKVFIEDCGYTSVWDIFSSELSLRFHLPEFPILYLADLSSGLRAGYRFSEASALEQVKKCTKPMLFFQGTLDDFVPYEMLDVLYEAKPGTNKARISAPGAGHVEAHLLLGKDYWKSVFGFIESSQRLPAEKLGL